MATINLTEQSAPIDRAPLTITIPDAEMISPSTAAKWIIGLGHVRGRLVSVWSMKGGFGMETREGKARTIHFAHFVKVSANG